MKKSVGNLEDEEGGMLSCKGNRLSQPHRTTPWKLWWPCNSFAFILERQRM